jgi:3-oxoadipate enol-lactonase
MKARTNGIQTHYEIHGDKGPWVVLSHSLACNLRMWDAQVDALMGRYRVLAYDTRGHGASDAPSGGYTFDMLVEDLRALLDAAGVRDPHFVGLSMGGMIGMCFALKYPGRFRSLVLCDTSSRMPPEAGAVWEQRIRTASEHGMEPLVEPTTARWFTEPFRKRDAAAVGRVSAMIRATPTAT